MLWRVMSFCCPWNIRNTHRNSSFEMLSSQPSPKLLGCTQNRRTSELDGWLIIPHVKHTLGSFSYFIKTHNFSPRTVMDRPLARLLLRSSFIHGHVETIPILYHLPSHLYPKLCPGTHQSSSHICSSYK